MKWYILVPIPTPRVTLKLTPIPCAGRVASAPSDKRKRPCVPRPEDATLDVQSKARAMSSAANGSV